MTKDYHQLEWDSQLEDDCRQLIRLAVREDLERSHDWTTLALAPARAEGRAEFRVRQDGVVAGLRAAELVVEEMNLRAVWHALVEDGAAVQAGQAVASISGSARDLLTAERLMLNLIGRLSGVATLTRQFVQAVSDAAIYDTRKTTPGWRRLEKHAVRCGGGRNHRTGLFDAVLIKDNHLLVARSAEPDLDPAEAVRRARQFVQDQDEGQMMVEVEVDTLLQLRQVLPGGPDVVLLDNMTCSELREAVEIRNGHASHIPLEASGGVSLETVAEIAATGVERVSVGALTHSAASLDVGLDWVPR